MGDAQFTSTEMPITELINLLFTPPHTPIGMIKCIKANIRYQRWHIHHLYGLIPEAYAEQDQQMHNVNMKWAIINQRLQWFCLHSVLFMDLRTYNILSEVWTAQNPCMH